MVPNTSELLPEPETPVNTVSRRFGSSMLRSLRLFTRAPCTRIRSWLSAACSAGDCVSVLVAMLIVSPSVTRGRLRGYGPCVYPITPSGGRGVPREPVGVGERPGITADDDPVRSDAV